MKKKFIWIAVVMVVFASIYLFYWFQWRPAKIRKECAVSTAVIHAFSSEKEAKFKECLRSFGLEE